MSIRFSCSCSRQFTVHDKHAGKQVRCQVCGTILRVPKASRSIDAGGSTLPAPQPTKVAEERLANFRRRYLTRILKTLEGQTSVHLAPNIPVKKLQTATSVCGVNAAESVKALIDLTVFGSAKNAIVFGTTSIYIHNSPTTALSIPYSTFPSRLFCEVGALGIGLGHSDLLSGIGGCSRPHLVSALCAIRSLYCEDRPNPLIPAVDTGFKESESPRGFAVWELNKLTWPKICVGCGCDNPSESLVMGLGQYCPPGKSGVETAVETTGMVVGNLAGGLLGGMLGQFAGQAMWSTLTDQQPADNGIVELQVPVCKKCGRSLDKAHLQAIAGPVVDKLLKPQEAGSKPMPEIVLTPVVCRTFRAGCLAVVPRSDRFTAAVVSANSEIIFNELDDCIRDREFFKSVFDRAAVPLGTLCEEDTSVQEFVVRLFASGYAVMRQTASCGFLIAPDIPARKEHGAREGCAVPEDDKVLVLVDCTLLGSAKRSLVFGMKGLYFYDCRSGSPKCIEYKQVTKCIFVLKSATEIAITADMAIDVSACSMPKDVLVEALSLLRAFIARQIQEQEKMAI